jgi:hypothetical protein
VRKIQQKRRPFEGHPGKIGVLFTVNIRCFFKQGKQRERKQPLFEKSGAKNFFSAGSWAVSATTPITQSHQSFFATFCSQKVALAF